MQMGAVLVVQGPITRADLPGLAGRLTAVLVGAGTGVCLVDIREVQADAAAVDTLARLQLAARRRGWRIALRGASPELRELVTFMGLGNALPG